MESLGGRTTTLDPNAHIADWTKSIVLGTAAFVVVALVLRSLCCSFQGRSVQDTDAPELEEFNSNGTRAKRVDSIRVKAGRYVSAAPLATAADEPEAAAWEGRPREPRPKRKPGSKKSRTQPL